MENNINCVSNKTLPSVSREDNIISMKPQAIKMDILLFKNDVLGEIKQIEKGIIEKSKETNDILKDKISFFDNKVNFINQQISSISNKMVNGIKIEEEINRLFQAREQLLDETTSNKIKLSMLEKETRDSINRIDELLKQTIIYPSVIGIKGKFRNFHDFIDFVVTESNTNNNFRQKNVMDLSSYKLKIEKTLQTLGFKIDNILSSCNSFTLRNIKELGERFDYNLSQYKEKLNELRIENSNYVIQLEKDTKDLRHEISIIKAMKNDIFSKVDSNVDEIKKENVNIVETFKNYKEQFEEMDKNVKKVEKSIENLMTQKIMLLFDSQKKINENIEEIRKQNFEFYNETINEKIKNIVNEQVKNVLGDININQIILNNNFNNEGNSNNNNYNSNKNVNMNNINNTINSSKFNNIYNYINDNNIQEKNNYNNNIINNLRKSNIFPNRYNSKYILSNNGTNSTKANLFSSPRKYRIDKRESAFLSPNIIMKKNNMNNLNKYRRKSVIDLHPNYELINKQVEESVKKNNNINQPIVKEYNINENILNELKNDNILSVKKSREKQVKKRSFRSVSNQEDMNDNISNNFPELNINKHSTISRNKKKNKTKFIFKNGKEELEKDNDEDNEHYIKLFNFDGTKRNSFERQKKEDLQKFQKLLKININDIDAKLNNMENESSSFEILNENQEIYDRFLDTNNLVSKEQTQNFNNINNFNKINILSSPLNINSKDNDEKNVPNNNSSKNVAPTKTNTNDFYFAESTKRAKNESVLKPIKNKKFFQINKKINENNSNFIKKTNSDLFNLQSDLKIKIRNGYINNNINKTSSMGGLGDQNCKQSEDSINKFHNYFIGFQFGNELDDKKKIRKNKRKSKSNKYIISESRKTFVHKTNKK